MQFQNFFFNNSIWIIICAFLLYLIGKILVDIYLADKSEHWPTAEGKILESTIQKHHEGNYFASYSTHIKYVYEVDGQQYKGSRISFGSVLGFKSIAQEYHRRYREGREIIIYYHPNKPSLATLETELPFETYFYLLFLSIFVLMIILSEILHI